jgi:hypothetical protein
MRGPPCSKNQYRSPRDQCLGGITPAVGCCQGCRSRVVFGESSCKAERMRKSGSVDHPAALGLPVMRYQNDDKHEANSLGVAKWTVM